MSFESIYYNFSNWLVVTIYCCFVCERDTFGDDETRLFDVIMANDEEGVLKATPHYDVTDKLKAYKKFLFTSS